MNEPEQLEFIKNAEIESAKQDRILFEERLKHERFESLIGFATQQFTAMNGYLVVGLFCGALKQP